MSDLTAREWLRRYLHDEGVEFNHNATAMENEIIAGLTPIIRRQERRRLWHAIDALLDGVTDAQVIKRLMGMDVTFASAYRLGVSTALMETAKEATDEH